MKHFIFAGAIVSLICMPGFALAHRSGCHTLHTCEPDANNYVCGDLGYPCSGATKLEDIKKSEVFVPVVVEKMFSDVFGRRPTDAESVYWKKRFRSDKDSIFKMRPAMMWHKAKGVTPVPQTVQEKQQALSDTISKHFMSVHEGKMPTASELAYWISRWRDKPSGPAIVGAMAHHKAHGISH